METSGCLIRPCLALFLTVIGAAAMKPLKTWTLCPRSDPKMPECLRGAIESAVHDLKDGNAKLGILPMDPLHLNLLQIEQTTGPVAINLLFKDIDITGIRGIAIDSVKVDWDKLHLEAEAHFEDPHYLTTIGTYEVDGKVLSLPIKGSGPCNLTFENFKCRIVFDGEMTERNGEKYADFTNTDVHIDTSKLHVSFDNLFNGDKALGDNMNLFLNENWSEILNELRPAISKAIGAAFRQITNQVFHKIPFQQVSPP